MGGGGGWAWGVGGGGGGVGGQAKLRLDALWWALAIFEFTPVAHRSDCPVFFLCATGQTLKEPRG